MSAPDLAVAGGGILGCAVAALAAEAGARVTLYEREAIAAAASGRNSGVLQHPLDAPLVGLYERSLALYGELGHGFTLPAEVSGVLVVAEVGEDLEPERAPLAARFGALVSEPLDDAALRALEPGLAPGLAGYRLATGRPVPPAAAARAWAARAREAGAELRVGAAVGSVAVTDGRAHGVTVDGALRPAGAVVVACGPWTPEVIDPLGEWRPIAPLWGVNVEVRLPTPPRHVVEQAGIEALTSAEAPASLFSIVTAGGVSAVGSTFLPERPDAEALAPGLLAGGARYLPALADPGAVSTRACPRPQAFDGRPLLGPLPGAEGLYVAAGHGAWGISLGPGSAELVVNAVLGRGGPIPAALAASRV